MYLIDSEKADPTLSSVCSYVIFYMQNYCYYVSISSKIINKVKMATLTKSRF